MAEYDFLFKNGTLVVPFLGTRKADLAVTGEKVKEVGEHLDGKEAKVIIDAQGKYIFPGAIDTHTHIGTSLPFWDDFEETTTSAARGGVTTLFTLLKVDFLDERATSYLSIFAELMKKLAGLSTVDFSFHFQIPSLAQIKEIPQYYSQLGIQSFKTYMAYKERKIAPGIDDGVFYCLLKTIHEMEDPPLAMLHAESDEIIKITTEVAKSQGLSGLVAWNSARPCFSEVHALVRACYLSRVTATPVYIVHVSCKESVDFIEREKRLGTEIIAETCPQYLVLNDQMEGNLAKINPPIRSKEDAEYLWEGIKRGIIDCIGTDHGSKKREIKGPNIWEAALGFPGIGTMFPLIFTEGSKRGLSMTKIAEICSGNNAKVFGLFPRKGTIQVGSDADLILVDPVENREVKVQEIYELSDFSPFEGMTLKGWPKLTMLRGTIIYQEGEILKKGIGAFIPRFPTPKASKEGEPL